MLCQTIYDQITKGIQRHAWEINYLPSMSYDGKSNFCIFFLNSYIKEGQIGTVFRKLCPNAHQKFNSRGMPFTGCNVKSSVLRKNKLQYKYKNKWVKTLIQTIVTVRNLFNTNSIDREIFANIISLFYYIFPSPWKDFPFIWIRQLECFSSLKVHCHLVNEGFVVYRFCKPVFHFFF